MKSENSRNYLLFVWPEEFLENMKSVVDENIKLEVLPEDFYNFLIYDYTKKDFISPQLFLKISENNLKYLDVNEISKENILSKISEIEKSQEILKAKCYDFYEEVYGKKLTIEKETIQGIKEYIKDYLKLKVSKEVVELILKSIFSGTAFIYTPYKKEVVSLIKSIFDFINNYSGNVYTYSVSELNYEKDYLIITEPIYEDIFLLDNNLIFVYDFKDIISSSEELKEALTTFCTIGGYIW